MATNKFVPRTRIHLHLPFSY